MSALPAPPVPPPGSPLSGERACAPGAGRRVCGPAGQPPGVRAGVRDCPPPSETLTTCWTTISLDSSNQSAINVIVSLSLCSVFESELDNNTDSILVSPHYQYYKVMFNCSPTVCFPPPTAWLCSQMLSRPMSDQYCQYVANQMFVVFVTHK